MARCEDYPCCGHEANDCPDSQGRMKCVECGRRQSKTATSSICPKCIQAIRRRIDSGDDGYEASSDFDYSMNY